MKITKSTKKKQKKAKKEQKQPKNVEKPKKKAIFSSFKRSWLDFRYWKSKWTKFNSPSSQIFIMMEQRSGKWDMFFEKDTSESFTYKGGEYVIDNDSMFYVAPLGMFALKYHQDLSIPVSQKIPVKTIEKAINASGTLDIENATNPSVVKTFIISDVIKDVIQSSGIHTYLKAMKLLVIITVIITTLHFLTYLMKSGIMKELAGVFGV